MLWPPLPVLLDHRVGGREDRLGRAVVLLELDDLGLGEVALEVEDVADVGIAEPVDRLVLVAHDHQIAVLGGEQLQQPVLGPVRVLVLVDQDLAERVPPAVADLLEQLERVDRADQEVVEVHRVRGQHPFLVEGVGRGDRLLEGVVAGRLGEGVDVDQLVLGARDLGPDRARRVALGVDPELVDAPFQHPQRVRLVVDREAARVAEALGVGAEHPRAGGVERHHPHRPGRAPDQLADALAHLRRRFVGEGDREDLPRPGRAGREQVGDAAGQDPGLAGPGAGDDQQRPLAVQHGLALGLVEVGQQPLDTVGADLGRRGLVAAREVIRGLRLGLEHLQPRIEGLAEGSASRRGAPGSGAQLGLLGRALPITVELGEAPLDARRSVPRAA